MPLSIAEIRSISILISRACQYVDDALSVAESGSDVAVTARVKTLLFRARDVERDLEARLAATEKAERSS
ncbi:histidine kinase [Rhodomicrobium vannielii ATCC 17100]|nr:histidine kinase [Rhodomicrobium vannielii ATCC 17100]